jgi:hypothetical protein
MAMINKKSNNNNDYESDNNNWNKIFSQNLADSVVMRKHFDSN